MRKSTAKGKTIAPAIRKYEPEDYESCRALWAELTEWHRHIYDDASIGGSDPGGHFDVHLKQYGPENIWVADDGGEILGMAGLIRREEGLEMEPLIVSERYRGQGIGKSLTEAVIQGAKKQGVSILSVSPVARNDTAIRFFHDLGFDTLGHLEMFIDFTPTNRQKWKGKERLAGRDFRY